MHLRDYCCERSPFGRPHIRLRRRPEPDELVIGMVEIGGVLAYRLPVLLAQSRNTDLLGHELIRRIQATSDSAFGL